MRKEFTREIQGGLNKLQAPWNLPPSESPDLLNVHLDDDGVRKRFGFTPLIHERPKMNAVRNVGWQTNSRVVNTGGSTNADFRVVPGHMLAGHRPAYYNATAFTFDLFLEIDDLTSAALGGNSNFGAPAGLGPPWQSEGGYAAWIRPILSKGPVKRTDYYTATTTGLPAWVDAGASPSLQWGSGTNDGMSFCLWLEYNNPTVGAWQFRLGAHILEAGPLWNLRIVTSGVTPEVGGRYHIIGVVSGSRIVLRIARIYGEETPTYTENTLAVTGTLGTNQCPIQVFDCPQEFIQAPTAASATRRPGLELRSDFEGGYWFAALRFEGAIEDLAIWLGDQLSGTNRDRETKLDLTQQSNLLGYWDMLGSGERVVQEKTGQGNHLYMVPWGPIFDPHSGGVGGDSWWFNGLTSYAMPDLDRGDGSTTGNPSWRYRDGTNHGAFQYAVLNNLGHGLSAAFWVDSIEPNQEQVIAEIHGVLRLCISPTGLIRGYCRTSAVAGVPGYQSGGSVVTSTFTVYPGTRYSVTLWRRSGGAFLDLYVNETLDASVGVVANSNTGNVVGGITIGMGAAIPMVNSAVALVPVNAVNTDSRSGFIGRIEHVKVIGGYLEDTMLDEQLSNWLMNQSRAWRLSTAAATNLFPADDFDTVANVGNGLFVELSGHHVNQAPLRYVIADTITNPSQYTLGAPGSLVRRDVTGTEGHNALEMMGARIFHTLLHYRLNVDDRDESFAGSYFRNIEYRYTGVPAAQANEQREVHIQESACTDSCGVGGFLQRRCIDSDVMSENYVAAPNGMLHRSATHRQRPYLIRSPREVGTRWVEGIMRPRTGQNPITLLADWEQQEGGRRITVVGAGRNLWQARPVWASDAPFAEVEPQALSFGGQDGDHAYVLPSNTSMQISGSGTINTIIVDFWCKPNRVDRDRTIVCYGQFSPTTRVNWRIGISEGALVVSGTQANGAKYWVFLEGTAPGGASVARFVSTIRVGRWNHVQVTMQTSGVTAMVNGKAIALFDVSGLAPGVPDFRTDPWAGDSRDAPTINRLDIGGHPRGRNVPTFVSAVSGNTFRNPTYSYDGLLADLRVKASGELTFVPVARATSSGALLVLPLNDGQGWRLDSLVGWDGQVLIRELTRIAEGLEESTNYRYASIAFRDRLICTNGESRAQQIRYTRPTDPSGPFRCEQLGIHPPVATGVTIPTPTVAGTGGTLVEGQVYQVLLTFGTDDGRESEPTLLGTTTVPVGIAAQRMTVLVNNLPRSWDPQVTVRRIYAGVTSPILVRTIPNNDGADHDFTLLGNETGSAVTSGQRLPAPRARHIAVAGAYVVLADLTEEPAGQNAIAWSQAQEASYWPANTVAVLDVEDGKPITGLNRSLGHVFVHKRDQVSQFQPAILGDPTTVLAEIRLSNASDGAGGADMTAKNLLYGTNDRGAFVFDNVNLIYLSAKIEPLWDNYDRSDDSLALQMHGLYHKRGSEWWISAPLRTEMWATTILVMGLDGEPAWTRLLVPEHSMLSGIEDDASQTRVPVIGTTSGRLLRLSDTVSIDGHDGVEMLEGVLRLTGTPSASTSTSLTIASGSFDVLLGGHEGVEAEITYTTNLVPATSVTVTRKIERNTATVLRWNQPLPNFSSVTAFTIGGYEGYWTSPWLEITEKMANREQDLERVILEFGPQSTAINVDVASIRQGDAPNAAFPAAYESYAVTPTVGWLRESLKPQRHSQGHFHRVRVRTTGISTPFRIVGYGFEARTEKASVHGGRVS